MQIFRNSAAAILAVISLSLVPSLSWGQAKTSAGGSPNLVGLQVGEVWPAGNIGSNVGGAIAPGLFYEYAASPIFSFQANIIRSSHNSLLNIFSTTAGIRANLTYYDKLVPYFSGGVGIYSVHHTTGSPAVEADTTNFGLNLGLGADLDLSDQFMMGLCVGLHNLFAAQTNTVNGTVENSGRWSYLFIRAGVRF